MEKKQFGEMKIECSAVHQGSFNDSLILNQMERLNLIEMTEQKGCELVYRATKDGFTIDAFHSKCDDKQNLISIIRNNLNYVFGGYTSVAWKKTSEWITDPKAFIFRLRRNGETQKDKFLVESNEASAFNGTSSDYVYYGNDIVLCNLSNQNFGSFCLFGASYKLPPGFMYNTDKSKSFLAGNFNKWLTTEIEVYEIKNPNDHLPLNKI